MSVASYSARPVGGGGDGDGDGGRGGHHNGVSCRRTKNRV
jgi:hypothetical protein